MTKPGRLYRVLKDCPKPIFKCIIEDGLTLYDDDITSIKIRHGQDEAAAGIPVATLETGFTVYLSPRSGKTTRVQLTPAADVYLRSLLGVTGIVDRFFGRTGTYSVEDTAKRVDTTMLASSWHSQLANRSTKFTFTRGHYVSDAITTMLQDPSLPSVPAVSRGVDSARGRFGQIYDPILAEKYTNIIGKLTSDIGVLVRQYRSGLLVLTPLSARRTMAATAMSTYPPIARSQVLSPSQWGTEFENDPSNHRIITRDGAMAPVSLNYGNLAEPWRDNRETDLQYLYFADPDQWHTLGAAGKYSEYTGAYKLPEVEIDLLLLIKRGRPYDLKQAGALLMLQAGDPVSFSGDWYPHLRGVQFAEGITESIGPNEWKLTLSLVPLVRVTGEQQTSPKPRTWEQATGTWNDATGTWDSYAL